MTTSPFYVKRGDAVPLTLDLGVELGPLAYTTGRVLIKPRTGTVIEKALTAPFTGTSVTVDLTPTDTATVGTYQVEVEMSPGPNTYPSDGYASLRILEDLG